MNTQDPHDVFISYAHEDRDRARAIAGAFEQHGLRVWWDRELVAGEKFRPILQEHLDTAKVVVVLWTANSIGKSFVRDEANRSLDKNKLVPVLLDDVIPPLGFGEINYLKLLGWRGDELAFEIDEIVDQIRKVARKELKWVLPGPWIVSRSLIRDIRTRIVLAIFLLAFAIVWIFWGNHEWQGPDFRWALVLVLIIFGAWLAIRASQFSRSKILILSASAISVIGLSTWALAFTNYYALPNFAPGNTGLLIARVEGDSQRAIQQQWLVRLGAVKESLSATGSDKKLFNQVKIVMLHRRLDSADRAREIAGQSNALIVLWSKAVQTFMTFADISSVARIDNLYFSNIETLNLADANTETGFDLAPALLQFTAAFGSYSRSEYKAARASLLEVIEKLLPADTSFRPTQSLLAATYLFLGNTYFLEGCSKPEQSGCETARDYYLAALSVFSVDNEARGNLFIAASNNLAVLTSRQQGGFSEAIDFLKDAEIACSAHDTGQPLPLVCAFTYYNLGLAFTDNSEYKDALRVLAIACEKLRFANIVENTSYFLNRCHQQQAYALAKLGERARDADQSHKLFIQAKIHAENSAAALLQTDDPGDIPAPLTITQARIAVGLKDFESAIKLLDKVMEDIDGHVVLRADVIKQYPALEVADISILMMISNVCLGASVSQMMSPDSRPPTKEMVEYMSRQIQLCSDK